MMIIMKIKIELKKKKSNYENKYEDDDEYIKPKKTYQQGRSRQNEDFQRYNQNDDNDSYNYDNRPIRGVSGVLGKNNNYKKNNNYEDDKYGNNYDNNRNNEKKKGNSNVLNCVINLLKELSTNELQMVKREIDRMNNY